MEKTIVTGHFSKKNIITNICLALAIISIIGSVLVFNASASDGDTYLYAALTVDTPEGIGVLFYSGIWLLFTDSVIVSLSFSSLLLDIICRLSHGRKIITK